MSGQHVWRGYSSIRNLAQWAVLTRGCHQCAACSPVSGWSVPWVYQTVYMPVVYRQRYGTTVLHTHIRGLARVRDREMAVLTGNGCFDRKWLFWPLPVHGGLPVHWSMVVYPSIGPWWSTRPVVHGASSGRPVVHGASSGRPVVVPFFVLFGKFPVQKLPKTSWFPS